MGTGSKLLMPGRWTHGDSFATIKGDHSKKKGDVMPRGFTFTTVSKTNLAWHLELKSGGPYWDWLWFDGWTEQGYWYGLTMAYRMENMAHIVGEDKKDWPLIDCLITSREGVTHRVAKSFPVEEFKEGEPWGVTIGDNYCIGSMGPDGKPTGYRVKIDMDGVGLDFTAKAVALGMQFVEAEHGYTFHHPKRNLGVGWWPLIVRSEIEGTFTFQGKPVKVKGLAYVERQLGNISFAGMMPHWFWGHFYAGDYTGIWTDSTSPAAARHRHFSPFVLYKGSDPILSTHNLCLHPEEFVLDEINGMPYPTTETLHATEGNVEMTAQIHPGVIIERELLIDVPGTSFTAENPGGYFRQYCDVDVQIRRWDQVEELKGSCQREFGWMTQWFPIPPRK